MTDFLSAFLEAADAPILEKVKWSEKISPAHPLRKLELFVRFWDAETTAYISRLQAAPETSDKWASESFYYVVTKTISLADGKPAFDAMWPAAWKAYVDANNSTVAALAELPSSVPDVPSKSLISTDDYEKGLLSPDYEILANWLKGRYDNQQGYTIMHELWKASMDYNGYTAESSKNSETTSSSAAPTEQA